MEKSLKKNINNYLKELDKYLKNDLNGLPEKPTIIDVASCLKTEQNLKQGYFAKLNITPDPVYLIEREIEHLEDWPKSVVRKLSEYTYIMKNEKINEPIYDGISLSAFQHIKKGQNPLLSDLLLRNFSFHDTVTFNPNQIKAVGVGVSKAYYLAFLQNELTKGVSVSEKMNPIQWKGKNKNDLIYLLWKMEKEDLISINSFGKDLSEIFADEAGKPIGNTLFNKYKSEFEKLKFPVNASEIDKLISILKKR